MISFAKRPAVTIGVTSYRSAATIQRCLDSVVAQSIGAGAIEVILVDDGSDDATVQLARGYCGAGFFDFHAHRQRHCGSASAGRNRILREAAADFVIFLDADDYLGAQAVEVMLGTAKSQRADIVSGGYVGVGRSAPNPWGIAPGRKPQSYQAGWLNSLHIQKLFRTEFARGLPYQFNPKLRYANDHPFMLCAFLYANRVSFVSDTQCYFLTFAGAEPHTGSDQKRAAGIMTAGRPTELTSVTSDEVVHVSRAALSPTEQLRFLHDGFGLLALARGHGGSSAELSGRIRADYWNRFLKLHLPVLLLRKPDTTTAAELGVAAARIAELYGARTSFSRLTPGAETMLQALCTAAQQPDSAAAGAQLQLTAQQVRDSAAAR